MRLLALLLLSLLIPTGRAEVRPPSTAGIVRFPSLTEAGDERMRFAGELLALCLEASGEPLRLRPVQAMNQQRGREAALRGEVDVILLPNTAHETGALLPVKLPLRRGLLGVRLLLARPETAEALMHVESSAELIRRFRMGYDRSWQDAWAFETMGFAIVYGNNYPGLFDMLRAGRFDFLSRGINELPAELAEPRLAGRGLVVVPGIALYYPLDDYFWVSPQRPELQAAIERGFLRVLEDGRYATLFDQHYGRAIREARLDERSVLHLPGYPVPPGTPLEHFDVLQPEVSRARLVPPAPPEAVEG
ncbi:MAG: hypothetical protein KatS3mg127_1162 [Silanimonas sp.]|nr:MAG: hypothetical protein KatS3mg127_1162 [Silanimonas sp.]